MTRSNDSSEPQPRLIQGRISDADRSSDPNQSSLARRGEALWSDENYRDLLLSYPSNLWSPEAVQLTVSQVPGVRRVQVQDKFGGLDINQSLFGNFNFIERLFSQERSLGSPYYVTILVAEDVGAIWDELEREIQAKVDEIRPLGIFPKIEKATPIGVGLRCRLLVEGLPVPTGSETAIISSSEAIALKQRIMNRIRRYVGSLDLGEPARYSEVLWAIMEEPGVVDCKALRLRRFPPQLNAIEFGAQGMRVRPQEFASETDVAISPTEIATLVEDLVPLVIE